MKYEKYKKKREKGGWVSKNDYQCKCGFYFNDMKSVLEASGSTIVFTVCPSCKKQLKITKNSPEMSPIIPKSIKELYDSILNRELMFNAVDFLKEVSKYEQIRLKELHYTNSKSDNCILRFKRMEKGYNEAFVLLNSGFIEAYDVSYIIGILIYMEEKNIELLLGGDLKNREIENIQSPFNYKPIKWS